MPTEHPPRRIRVGSALLIEQDGQILLGRRAKQPNEGRWVLPGGGLEFGETHEQAAEREALEEVGLVVQVDSLAGRGVYHIVSEDTHRVIVYSRAHVVSGSVRASSDISEARFFSREELLGLDITPIPRQVLLDEGWIAPGKP